MCLSGLDDQGIYRVVGVNSKVNKLLNLGLSKFLSFTFSKETEPVSVLISVNCEKAVVNFADKGIVSCLDYLCVEHLSCGK